MSSRTTTTKSSTTNNRGRGRGRGRQANRNSNYIQSNLPNEDMNEIHPYNERRRGPPTFAHNRGSYQPVNRGLGNFRGNNNGNIRPNRSDNSVRSSSPDSNSDRIPRHAQNPFFVGELMSRFSSMLPSPSFLEDEAAGPQQPEVNTFDTMRNTSAPRNSSTWGSNRNSDFYNQNENKSHQKQRFDVGRNGNQEKNREKCMNEDKPQFRPQHLAAHFSGRDRESENVRMNDEFDLPVNTSNASVNDNCNKYRNSKQENNSDNYHIKTSASSNNSVSPILTRIPLEKRKAIMKSFGFSTESLNQSSNSSQSKATDSNQPPQNFHRGLIAERTSPRVRYNLESEPVQNTFSPTISDQNKSDNSKLKPGNRHPQNYSVVDAERCNRPNSYSPANIQNSNPLPGKSSDGDVMYSVKQKVENKTQPSAISESFFSQLDAIRSSSSGSGNVRYPSDNTRIGKHKKSQENYENRPSRSTVNKFNPFLRTEETTTSQDLPQRSGSPKQRRQRHETNNHNPALLQLGLPPYPHRLTERDVTGRNYFNVQRPVRDVNERVPSREEALERIQEQYEIQRAEYEAKKKEKEAKKREEYLARYKHVDQGHRLNDGLLDEAAGYAAGYDQYETVEDIRQRQQEQLRQDALAYQERQREEQEKQKRIEEKKAREKLEKNKHLDAGYKLGHGDNRGNSRWTSNTRFKNKQPKKSSHENERSDNENERSDNENERSDKNFRDSISPDLLLEGETEEEAIQRQEEQLIVEMLIQDQMKLQAWNKLGIEQGDNKEFDGNEAQSPANSVSMNPFLSARHTPNPEPGSSRNVTPRQLNRSGGSSGAVPKNHVSKYSKDFENNEQTVKQMRNIERNIEIEAPNVPTEPENFGTKRQSQSPQLKQLDSKVSRNSVSQVPASSQIRCDQEPLPKKPASCILKNQNGAVLVLRSTPEDLNRALASRLEVQDEADKLGYSAHYKPTPEQMPLYSNNRFERKLGVDTDKPATGAIPKNTSSSAVKPMSSVATNVAPNSETPKQEEPPFDHKAELRAARLRFQQQYEEALKKKQEQKNES